MPEARVIPLRAVPIDEARAVTAGPAATEPAGPGAGRRAVGVGAQARRRPGLPAPPDHRRLRGRRLRLRPRPHRPRPDAAAAAALRQVVPGRDPRARQRARHRRRADRGQPLRHHPGRRADDDAGAARPPPGAAPPAAARRRPGLHAAGRRRRSRARAATPWPATPTPSGCCRNGELVGVFPEGFKGIGKPFSERYKLQRFGRGGFVSAALRTGTPIIPVLDRRRRGDLPDDRQHQDAGPAARACPTSRSRRRSRCSARSA